LNGQILVDAEPWYKTAELEFVDVGLLDAIIISNPAGMLGLPFLTRHPDFGAKARQTIFSLS
jgi:integrator complex subunit 9